MLLRRTMPLAQLFGIAGLILIITGVLMRKRQLQDEFYIVGGLSLLWYSISIGDWIFIILQSIFVVVAAYDFSMKRKK